jgi:hypothetical protein
MLRWTERRIGEIAGEHPAAVSKLMRFSSVGFRVVKRYTSYQKPVAP